MERTESDGRLRSSFTWLFSGNVLYSACQWGIVWVLARFGSTEQVGQYALGMAVSGPIMLFGNFQLRALIASDLKEDYSLGQYLSFRFVSLGLATLAIAGVAVWTRPATITASVIALVGAAQALEFVSESYYAVMQREGRLDRLSRSLLIKGPLALACLAVFMYTTRNIVYALAGLALGRLAVLLFWDSRLDFVKRELRAKLVWDWRRVRGLLRLALPLGVISMLVSVNASIPRYFLEAYRGSSELGIFAAIASLLTAGMLIVSSMGQSLFVPVAQACIRGDRTNYRRYLLHAILLGAGLGVTAILVALSAGEKILSTLFGPEYSEHSRLLVLLMMVGAISFIASGLGYIMTAARSLGPQIPLMAVSAAAGTAASAWLIPAYGLEGATAALLVSALIQLGGTVLILMKIDRNLQCHGQQPLILARCAEGATR